MLTDVGPGGGNVNFAILLNLNYPKSSEEMLFLKIETILIQLLEIL